VIDTREALHIDFDAMPTLGDIARYHARVRPTAPAIWFEGAVTNFTTLDERSNQVANALIASGCTRGERVVHLGKGCGEFLELMFGVAKAGVVLAPVIFRLATPEVTRIIADAGARFVFIGAEQAERLPELRAALPAATFICFEGGAHDAFQFAVCRAWPLPPMTLRFSSTPQVRQARPRGSCSRTPTF
jgi:long-chain acyl-CoA synthetase